MKEDALKLFGLNDKEVAVYLANLQLGSSLANEIAKNAELNRSSTYGILYSLERKGFVNYTLESGKRHYHAIDPTKLLGLLKERELFIKDALTELQDIKESVIKKPKVEVYTGINGLKSIFEDILENSKEFECIASKKHLSELFKYYLPQFVKRRIKGGIRVKIITDAKPYDKKAPYKLIRENIKTATWIYNGKIAMISLEQKEPIGILIEEKNFYNTHKIVFGILWNNLSAAKV